MGYTLLDDSLYFPPVNNADEHGILAFGGDLSINRLLLAYQSGIFPWYNEDDLTILWWSPDPRFVLYPDNLRVSKSMKQVLKKGTFKVTYDQNFREVMIACKYIKRKGQYGTWITDDMLEAYCQLHEAGFAHSVEVWTNENQLVGGLYGVSLGTCFFGESMFSKVSNASKAGFISLAQKLTKLGVELIDCQVYTQHLESLGAEDIPRDYYIRLLKELLQKPTLQGNWSKMMQALD